MKLVENFGIHFSMFQENGNGNFGNHFSIFQNKMKKKIYRIHFSIFQTIEIDIFQFHFSKNLSSPFLLKKTSRGHGVVAGLLESSWIKRKGLD